MKRIFRSSFISRLRKNTRAPNEIHSLQTEAAQPPVGIYDEYRSKIEASGLFDAKFYAECYPSVIEAGLDPLDHYLEHGIRDGLLPNPKFDANLYISEYPDVKDHALPPFLHHVLIGQSLHRDLRPNERFIDAAKRMALEVAAIEPAMFSHRIHDDSQRQHISYGGLGWTGLAAWQALFDSLQHPYDRIVFVPWLTRGGADLVATNAVRAAVEAHGLHSTLLVLTDYAASTAADWLPHGAHVRSLSELDATLSSDDRTAIVELLIRTLRPRSVLNVNSRACWEAFAQKGGPLSKCSNLFACLFCRDYTPDGKPAGYADTHFRDSFPHLTKVYFDNEQFLGELARDYGIPPSLTARLELLRQPVTVPHDKPCVDLEAASGQVLWAGRFCKQKNISLLIEIATLAPDLHFDVYGYGDGDFLHALSDAQDRLPNLHLCGGFSSIEALPLTKYSAFLFTSLWEGLPLTLTQIGASGLPIVASAVGGVPEIVGPDTGWLIEATHDASAYVAALRGIRDRPDLAAERSLTMRSRLRTERSWTEFASALRRDASSFLA